MERPIMTGLLFYGLMSSLAIAQTPATTVNSGKISQANQSIAAEAVNAAPSVNFLKPQAKTFVEGEPVVVEALVTDDGLAQNVLLYVDGVATRWKSSAPYTWNDTSNGGSSYEALNTLTVGEHTLRMLVRDSEGLQSETSMVIEIIADTPNQAPSVSFSQPSDNQSVIEGNDVTVVASANDADGRVSRVELYVNNVLISIDSTAPYSWNLSDLALGSHVLRLVTVDNNNAQTETSIGINVIEQPPIADIANRTSGIAPLSVHFDSGYEDERFHDYSFTWDFGDASAGNHAHNGLDKNTDTGPIAGHLYENAGTYNATLTVRDASNAIVNTQSVTIVVTDTDAAYAGSATRCVSKNGDFTGCPEGAQQLTIDDSQIDAQFIDSNVRVLLRRGDTWDSAGLFSRVVSNLYIGAYGTCVSPDTRGICINAPTLVSINRSFPTTLSFRTGSKDITIEHIHLTASSIDNAYSINFFTLNNLTINRVKGTVVTPLSGDGMHNSGIYNSDFSGGIVTMYVDGQNMVMNNSTFHDSRLSA